MSIPADMAAMIPCMSFILAVEVAQILEWEITKNRQTSFIWTSEQEQPGCDSDRNRCRERQHHRRSKDAGLGGECRYPCAQ